MNVQIPVKWLQELLALCGPEDHELRERVMVSITAMDEQTARAVAMPEPDGFLESHPFGPIYHRGKPSQIQMICGACPPMYEAGTVRALLATGGQAQAVTKDEATWCSYIAGMIGCYLKEEDESPRVKAIAGIIERRLWALPAPQAQADARDAALLDFIESHAEGVIRLDAVPNYLYWGKHWEHKTARAAIAAAKGE